MNDQKEPPPSTLQSPNTLTRRQFLKIAAVAPAPLFLREQKPKIEDNDLKMFFASSVSTLSDNIAKLLNRRLRHPDILFAATAAGALAYPDLRFKSAERGQNTDHVELPYPNLRFKSAMKKTYRRRFPQISRRRLLIGTVATGTGATIGLGVAVAADRKEIYEAYKKTKAVPVSYDPAKIFGMTPLPTAIPQIEQLVTPAPTQIPDTPTAQPTPTKTTAPTETNVPPSPAPTTTLSPTSSPTTEPVELLKQVAEQQAAKEIGKTNLAEYFLGNLLDQFKQRRLDRAKKDKVYENRITPELLSIQRINLLLLGIDESRNPEDNRMNEWTGRGFGRSDSIIVVSFDPHTFKTTLITIPRDMHAPETLDLRKSEATKINSLTLEQKGVISGIRDGGAETMNEAEQYEVVRKIIESATGLPIDMIVKGNINFISGVDDKGIHLNGFTDDLFPEGVEIEVRENINDKDGLGVNFKKGVEIMNGHRLMQYWRTRKDYTTKQDREEREREIVKQIFKKFASHVAVKKPDMNVLDKASYYAGMLNNTTILMDRMIIALDNQKKYGNLFFDVNIIEILKQIRLNIPNLALGTNPLEIKDKIEKMAVMGVLAQNTNQILELILQDQSAYFMGFTPRPGDGLVDWVDPNENYWNPGILKIAGQKTISIPNQFGNHLKYWEPLRKKVTELISQKN